MENIGTNLNHIELDVDLKVARFSGKLNLNVYYEDTDLSGYVYHANYLKYCERSRSELIDVKLVRDLFKKGVHFVVAEANLKYKKPALYGDSLVVCTELEISKSPKTKVHHRVFKENGDRPIVEAEILLVLVDANGRPIETPDFMFDLIAKTINQNSKLAQS